MVEFHPDLQIDSKDAEGRTPVTIGIFLNSLPGFDIENESILPIAEEDVVVYEIVPEPSYKEIFCNS